MTNREAISLFNDMQGCRHQALYTNDCGDCERCKYYHTQEQLDEAVDLAISALEKREQSNAQNVNSTHRSCPNALESLNILEQAKDDKGCVPMSLVRQAFRNILEKNRWIPVTERLPEEDKDVFVTVHFLGLKQTHPTGWNDHIKPSFYVDIAKHYSGEWCSASDEYKVARSRHIVTAWRPLPEPYKAEEEHDNS